MKKENKVTKQELITALEASDVWTKDRFGHFKLTFKSIQYRLKLQDLVVRYEKKVGSEWFCRVGDYYKSVKVQDGRLWIGGIRIPIVSDALPTPAA